MKKTVLILVGLLWCISGFCKPLNKRKVEWNGEGWVLNTKEFISEKIIGLENYCGEGISFVYEDKTYKRFLVDKNKNKLSDKDFMHVGYFSKGKTIVSGYMEDEYESDRIYDVVTDTVSDPLENLWVYCAFVEGMGAFSYKNAEGKLKAVLLNLDLQNVVEMEFDEFCELDFEKTIWHFRKNGKDYFVNKNGKLI